VPYQGFDNKQGLAGAKTFQKKALYYPGPFRYTVNYPAGYPLRHTGLRLLLFDTKGYFRVVQRSGRRQRGKPPDCRNLDTAI
jgi:hypothetical protein